MRRKTNLFYSAGKDSNFVTFSNYSEALTGNILATDAKMFPSKFICLYVPSLDVDDVEAFATEKSKFIREWLSGYYENKLAFLRDHFINEDVNVETHLNPLKYLLDTIKTYDNNMKITFIGEICEQDYNGTFMDNICIIESSDSAEEYDYEKSFNDNDSVSVTESEYGKLYGWPDVYKLPDNYQTVVARYDATEDDNKGIYYPDADTTNLSELLKSLGEPEDKTIKFNILIPLFNIYTYDLKHQATETIDNDSELVLDSASTHNQFDTPMGMWFSDKLVKLERENDGPETYRPSWSLCISSQFKSFPYSDKYPNEITETDNPDKFATIALVLAKQSALLNEITTLKENLANGKYTNIVSANTSGIQYTTASELNEINEKIKELDDVVDKIITEQEGEDNENAHVMEQLNRINQLFSYNYGYFKTSNEMIQSYYNKYSDLAQYVEDTVRPSLQTFEQSFDNAMEQFGYIDSYYSIIESYHSYFKPSYGVFSENYGYFNDAYNSYYIPSYSYFENAYGYFNTAYTDYFIGAYTYYIPSYEYVVELVGEGRWFQNAYEWTRDTYESYYVLSYGYFYGAYGYFYDTYNTYYVPSFGYFNDAYSYYIPSYSYFENSYGYFNTTYNSYLTPAYAFFTYGYEYFVDVMTKEWWAHDAYSYMSTAYSSYMLPSYGYFVPQIGYLHNEMGFFHPNIDYFRRSFDYFVPSYNYFKSSYPYFEQHYPIFEEKWDDNVDYWNNFLESYNDFMPKYETFDNSWQAYERFYDTYTYYITTYDAYFVPQIGNFRNEMAYFRPSYGFFRSNIGYFVTNFGYFKNEYSTYYLDSYSYFTDSFGYFNDRYPEFNGFVTTYDTLTGNMNTANDNINDFNERYDEFVDKYDTINTLSDDLALLKTDVNGLKNGTVYNLQNKVNVFEQTRFPNIEERITNLEEKDIDSLADRITRLEAQIEIIKEILRNREN